MVVCGCSPSTWDAEVRESLEPGSLRRPEDTVRFKISITKIQKPKLDHVTPLSNSSNSTSNSKVIPMAYLALHALLLWHTPLPNLPSLILSTYSGLLAVPWLCQACSHPRALHLSPQLGMLLFLPDRHLAHVLAFFRSWLKYYLIKKALPSHIK